MCCSLQRGDTWVRCQPCHPALLAPRPQRPKPYLLLSSCRERRSSRSCRTHSWRSASSSASLRCSPRLWPSSASASRAREQAARSASCTRASSGDREHRGVTTTPLSQCPLGLRHGMLVARPYLGRGGHTEVAGSGCPRAEPGSPHSAAALALATGHRHRWAILQRGTGAESLSPAPHRAWGEHPPRAMGCAKPGPPWQPWPQCSTVPLALPVEARRRSSCSRSRSLVQMDSSRRWRRLRISTKCSSSRSAPATAKEMAQGGDGHATCPTPSPLSCPIPEPHPAAILVPGLLPVLPHPARMSPGSPTWTLPVSFWLEGYPDGRAP